MDEPPKQPKNQALADFLMLVLCSQASFWLLASPLVPYEFDLAQFIVAYVVLTVVLGMIGVKLNHLAARNARVSVGRWRR